MAEDASPPAAAPWPGRRAELVEERVGVVRELLRERHASAALLRSRANFAWLTVGGENHVVLSSQDGVAALLVTERAVRLLTAVNEAARVSDEELAGLDIGVEMLPWHEESAVDRAARRIAGTGPLDDAALEDAIRPWRSVLTQVEAERMAVLAARLDEAADAALAGAVPGVTEDRVAATAMHALAIHGIRAPVLLAAADERIARYRHPLPTGRPIRGRLMLVVVAERWGLHVALTRFAELEPVDDDLRGRKEAVQRVHDAMLVATRPGATFGEVLDAGRTAYSAEGHPDEWQLHHQGGSIGYQGRERIATPGDRTPIVAGMAFAWNPSITGTKAEETVLVSDDGHRMLTGRR